MILSVLAAALFVVLKTLGRAVRLADTMRALSLLTWLIPGTSLLLLAAYYPLSTSALARLENVITAAVVIVVAVTVVASVRREPRSTRFMLDWAGGTLLLLVATTAAWSQPDVDLRVQAPLAGYAGRADSFEEYLSAVRTAATKAERAAEANREETQGDRQAMATPPTSAR